MKLKLLVGTLLLLAACGSTPEKGDPGVNGSNGKDGSNGLNGQDGHSCSVSKSGAVTTITCPDGTTSTITDGSDPSATRTIELCHASHPGTYPEYGLCIDNQLYAVYWDGHNAWMALIVPGTYHSTSSTDSCSFIVGNNCQVTN